MDRIDKDILAVLQQNAETTLNDISKAVHLSTTPCWKRINRLKKSGYIQQTVALVDAKRVDLSITVFVLITMESHDKHKLELFAEAVQNLPEIMECHRMSGLVDYLLKVVTKDIAGYDAFYKKLISQLDCLKVNSNFSIETIKQTTALPLSTIPVDR